MLLNKRNLEVVSFASKESSRYAIRAVQVSSDGTVATNGHMLAHVTLPKDNESNFPTIEGLAPTKANGAFLLSAEAAKTILKAIPNERSISILNNAQVCEPNETTLNVAVTDLETTQVFKPKKLTGNFPDWKGAVELHKESPVITITLNASFLAQVASAAAHFTDSHDQQVVMELWDAKSAVRFKAKHSDGQQWTAVLCPMAGE